MKFPAKNETFLFSFHRKITYMLGFFDYFFSKFDRIFQNLNSFQIIFVKFGFEPNSKSKFDYKFDQITQ